MLKLFFKVAASSLLAVALSLCSGNAFAQNRSISGTVVDGQNVPVIGASVIVVGSNSLGTITDLDG